MNSKMKIGWASRISSACTDVYDHSSGGSIHG